MRRRRGFTLIELMVSVSILAIIAAVAIPAFTEQMRKSRRSQAIQGLSDLQLRQEKWRSNHATYGTAAQVIPPTSDYYTFSVTAGTNTATDVEMTAAPKAGTAQVGDSCGTFTLRIDNDDNSNPAGALDKTAAKTDCW